ncbi:MAG: 3'-5' exonuclease [Planctomycetota bacterium]
MRIVFFDLETTGLDPVKDEIIQIAALAVSPLPDLNILHKFEVKLLPSPAGVKKAKEFEHTVYDPGVWYTKGVQPKRGLMQFNSLLRHYSDLKLTSKAGRPYKAALGAGHNYRFDIEFLKAQNDKFGLYCPMSYIGLDTLQLALAHSILVGEAYQSYSLESLVEVYGIEHTQAHEAMSDVRATLNLARDLFRRISAW